MAVDVQTFPGDERSGGALDPWYELARALGCSAAEGTQWALLASRHLHYPTDRQEFIDQLRDHLDARLGSRSWRRRMLGDDAPPVDLP